MAFLCWHFLKEKEQYVLYVAVLDESLNEEALIEIQEQLQVMYNTDGKTKKVIIDDDFHTGIDGITKLEVYLKNKQVDIIIAEEDMFSLLAGYGFLQDLNSILDEGMQTDLAKRFYYAHGYKDSDEISFQDNETGQGAKLAYGLDISESKAFKSIRSITQKPVLGIAQDTLNKENAIMFLRYLIDE